MPRFDHPSVHQLAKGIADVAAKLPKDAAELIDVAVDTTRLDADVAELLDRFGAEIWGRESERTWLVEASNGVENYEKNLVFEEAMDRLV